MVSRVFLNPLLDAYVVLSWWGDLQSARSALMSTRAPGSLAVVVATEDTIVKAEAEEAFSQMLGEGEKEEEGDWRKITFPLHLLSLNGDFDCTVHLSHGYTVSCAVRNCRNRRFVPEKERLP